MQPLPTTGPTHMLENSGLSGITGTRVRGSERIATKDVLAFLGLDQRETKRLAQAMRLHGWSGPKSMRFTDATGKSVVASGYERKPGQSDGVLTRNKVTAAGIAVNAQLKADEQALRRKKSADVLERLLKLIEQEKKKIPTGPIPSLSRSEPAHCEPMQDVEHAELERSDVEASVMASRGDGSEEG